MAQIRISESNHRALGVIASSRGATTQETADRIIQEYILADPKVQKLLRAADAASGRETVWDHLGAESQEEP